MQNTEKRRLELLCDLRKELCSSTPTSWSNTRATSRNLRSSLEREIFSATGSATCSTRSAR